MKKSLFLFAVVMIVVLFAAGLSTENAKAIAILTPEEWCEYLVDAYSQHGYVTPGSGWVAEKTGCLIGYKIGVFENYCSPGYDFIQFTWGPYPVVLNDIAADIGSGWYISEISCVDANGRFIKDPNKGDVKLGQGVSFSYEAQTCTNGCHISKFGLTGAAKKALGSLNGKVWSKSYVQIRDDDGDLVSGDFKLCFQANGAKNPYFFRFGGGNSWAPMGGYWQGNNFCMSGTISGNYVLVDMP